MWLFLGFAPGFAYMTGGFSLPRCGRRGGECPPAASPSPTAHRNLSGGDSRRWRLLGHVAARMFEPRADPPALLRPGDRVVFEPVGRLEEPPPRAPRRALPAASAPRARAGRFTSVQGGPATGSPHLEFRRRRDGRRRPRDGESRGRNALLAARWRSRWPGRSWKRCKTSAWRWERSPPARARGAAADRPRTARRTRVTWRWKATLPASPWRTGARS